MPRTVSVRLQADVSQFTAAVGGKAAGSVKSLSGELDKVSKAGKLDKTTAVAAGLGLGLAGVAAAAVKMAMDFDKSMSAVSAATHASSSELSQLRAAAIQAGKDTQYSATAAANGITELSKAGVSTANILGGGLKGALDLAAAGQIDVGEAAETAASAMTQFGLSGNQVPHIADLLAAAAGKAQGSVHDMGAALNQSGLVAAQFGLSIEDTTGALAEFASAGLLGSDAGTSFKTMLLALANPSKESKDLMHELGISFYDTQGKFIGVAGVAQVLQTRLKDLTQEQRNQALGQIFGNDAIRAASILYKDGADGVQKWAKAVNDSGYAQDQAAKLTDNLAGDLERLKGSLETVAIQAGGGANDGLRVLAKSANAAVDAFSNLHPAVQEAITIISGVGGVTLLAGAGFLKLRGTAHDLMDELRDMGPRGASAAEGIGKVAGLAGRLGLVGAAVGVAFGAFQLFGDWALRKTEPTKANIDKLTESIKQFAATGQAVGELAARYGQSLQMIGYDVGRVTSGLADLRKQQELWKEGLSDPSLGENWNPVDPQSVQDIKDLDTALAQLVKSGGAQQAAIFMRQLQASGGMTAARFAQLTSMLPNYTEATKGASLANTGLAKGFGDTTANAQTMTNSLQSAIDAGEKLTDVWTQLNGALLAGDKANLAAAQAIDAVKASFKENKKAVDGNSEAALKNRIAVGEAAKAAAAAAQAKYEETGSVSKATHTYDGYLGQLRKTLLQSGLTKKQVDGLISSYGKMPDSVITKVGITGDKAVAAKLAALSIQQAALKKGMPISTSAARALAGDEKAAKQRGLFSAGGWTGPGDTYAPAGIVHADEHVIKKTSRRSLEAAKPGALDYMNETGRWPGYARGGIVAWPFPTTAAMTRIPSKAEALAAIVAAAPGGPGGPGYKWMEAVARAAFPGISVYSDVRPGAMTLTGNRSYHGMVSSVGTIGRAVDFEPSKAFAQWVNARYFAATRELITPWQSLNIKNGRRHTYSALVENQHNFAGGNAHDHWAMAGGGVINEPVFGFGLRSGDTYSFGERGRETVTPGAGGGSTVVNHINLNVALAAGANIAEAGRQIAHQLEAHFARGGEIRVNGRLLVGN